MPKESMRAQAQLFTNVHCTIESLPVCESTLFQHLLWEGALHIHDQLQHLIVGFAWEQDFAGKQLVDHTTHAPDVQGMVCKTPITY